SESHRTLEMTATTTFLIQKSLPRRDVELTEEPAWDVSNDRDLSVACFVDEDSRMPIQTGDPFAVAWLVRVERQRHAADVEGKARGDCFHQVDDPPGVFRPRGLL